MAKRTQEKVKAAFYEKPNLFLRTKDEPSQTFMILGRSRTGKTHFLVENLNKLAGKKRGGKGPDKNRPVYDLILLFTESLDAEPLKGLSEGVLVMKVNGFHPRVVALLKRIQDASNTSFRFLVILDDVVSGLRGGIYPKMLLTMRNSHISCCTLLQYIKIITPAARQNCHHIFITGLRDDDWEYMMRGFMGSHVKELIGNHGSLYNLASMFRQWVGDDIVHFDNVKDELTFVKRTMPS